jgi:hypothetical protein
MGVFAEARGFVRCDGPQLGLIRRIAEAVDPAFPYRGGWAFPEGRYNRGDYVFHGARIRATAVNDVPAHLRAVARVPPSDEDADRVTGLFLVSHEEDGVSEWQIRDGDVHIGPVRPELRYLDE